MPIHSTTLKLRVQINADTLSIGITVTNFVSGNGKITIEDGNGATVYEKDINGARFPGVYYN